MDFLKKPFVTILLVLGGLVFIGWYVFFKPTFVQNYTSPDGRYTLEVYAERRLFAMPGDGGSNMATLVLKRGGRKIATVTPEDDCCSIRVSDVQVQWNNTYVSYGVARSIDLKTGRFD